MFDDSPRQFDVSLWSKGTRTDSFIGVDSWGDDVVAVAVNRRGKAIAVSHWGTYALQDLGERPPSTGTASPKPAAVARLPLATLPTALALSPDGRHLAFAGFDGIVHVTRLEDRRTVSWAAGGAEWIAWAEDGYFDASRRGGSLLHAVQGYRRFHVDQLGVAYNRPDLSADAHVAGGPRRD